MPTPTPESLGPPFKRNVRRRATKSNAYRSGKNVCSNAYKSRNIVYSRSAISRWERPTPALEYLAPSMSAISRWERPTPTPTQESLAPSMSAISRWERPTPTPTQESLAPSMSAISRWERRTPALEYLAPSMSAISRWERPTPALESLAPSMSATSRWERPTPSQESLAPSTCAISRWERASPTQESLAPSMSAISRWERASPTQESLPPSMSAISRWERPTPTQESLAPSMSTISRWERPTPTQESLAPSMSTISRWERPTPTLESLAPPFKRNVRWRATQSNAYRSGKNVYSNAYRSGKIAYSKSAISRWFAVGLDDGKGDASVALLKPVSVESFDRKNGEKPVILVKSNLDGENNEVKGSPWLSIAENILPDLLSSFKVGRAEIESEDLKDVKLGIVARLGKILFHGRPSVNVESGRKDYVTETTLMNLKRTFYPSLPASYIGNVMAEIAIEFLKVKDIYHVLLSESTQPDSILRCKCSKKDDKKLHLYTVELNQVRDMVVDVSCPDMDLDLRLMLYRKRILTSLTDDEMQSISNLIDSAVIDPDVKGGLRWPFGKVSAENRYRVVRVVHTMATSYQSSSIRLKVRYADPFDFRTGDGEASKEVVLKLKGIVSGLEQEVEANVISDMLKDTLSLIWQHFLRCEPFLT